MIFYLIKEIVNVIMKDTAFLLKNTETLETVLDCQNMYLYKHLEEQILL